MQRDTIDLERTIYDADYRREIITRLNRTDAADAGEARFEQRIATPTSPSS